MPPQIRAKDPTKTASPNFTTMSSGFLFLGLPEGMREDTCSCIELLCQLGLWHTLRTRVLSFDCFRESCDAYDSIPFAIEVENTNTLGIPADFADVVYFATKHFSLRGDQHDFVAVSYLQKSDGRSVSFSRLDADNALAAATLNTIFTHGRPFTVAAFRDGQDRGGGIWGNGFHADDFVPLFKRDPFHTVCRPSHRPHFFLFKPNGNALSGPQKNFPLPIGQLYADQSIAALKSQGNDAALPWIAEGGQFCLLDDAFLSTHHDISVFSELFHRQRRRDFFASRQGKQIDQGLALCGPAGFRNFMDFQPVDLSRVREKKQ